MGLNYVKQGNVVQPVYDGFKLQSGLTVVGTAYEPNGSGGFQQYASGNPIAFSEIGTTGRYTAQVTVSNVNGWHFIEMDATDNGKSRPSLYKYRVQNNSIQEIHALAAAIDQKVDDIQGAGFDTATDSLEQLSDRQVAIQGAGFVTGTHDLKSLRDAVSTLQSSVDAVESSINATIFVESAPDIEIPDSGSTRYKVTIRNYGAAGMDDFDAVPSIAFSINGTDVTATRVFDARTGGAATTTMASGGVGTGVYEAFIQLTDTDTPSFGTVIVTGVNDGETRTYQTDLSFVDAGAAAGAAQESTLTDMKGAGFDTATDSLEALRNRMDALASTTQGAGFNSSTDSLEAIRDNQELFKTKSGGTFDRELMSLEAIRLEIDDSIRFNGLGAH